MTVDQCVMGVCFIPLDGSGQKFFGFSEFLAGLALMVLAWTIADVRYRFRVRTAPIPLLGITFSVVAAVGVLTLLTDLWRAEQWLVPKGNLLTPASWQAILGGLFLLTFLSWTWFAFIRPPTYGRHNAERFAQTLYQFILKGSPAELAVIADELAYSARALVRHATDRGRLKNCRLEREDEKKDPPKVERYANDLLLLIADKRLCRAIVDSSPGTALAVFQAMADAKKHGIQVETFAKNIVNEALANKDCFLYHEAEGYESGLIGYHKPLSQAMFSNYEMAETIGTLLDPDIYGTREWDAAQWEAYCRIVLMTFRSYVEEGYGGHSFVLYRAKSNIEHAVFDLYKLDGVANGAWGDDLQARLQVIVEFIKDAVEILEKKGVPDYLQLRIRDKNSRALQTFYDHIANLIFEVVFAASAVTSPNSLCWWIQHNSVWSTLFNFDQLTGKAGAAVRFKVRRLLYSEIAHMKRFPNFKGAKILGFCLNVMGLTIGPRDYDKESRALQKAVLAWTKKNYVWLHGYNPRVAEACLVDGMTFDAENRRLVRMYPAEGLRREPRYVYLELDPAPPEPGAEVAAASQAELNQVSRKAASDT
ncbi:MAG: hypothetical protein V4632_07120 [Pseudomonadota bacterium]